MSTRGIFRRRQSVILTSTIVLVLLVAGAAWWAATRIKSPARVAAEAQPPSPSPVTARVRSMQIENTVITRGVVEAAGRTEISATAVGVQRLVVTRTPLNVGDKAREGSLVLEVSGRPIFVLEGRFPLYRDLSPGDAGRDVAQLQASLRRLGYPVGKGDVFDSVTQQSLLRLYDRAGYNPPPAGGGEATAPISEFVFVPQLPAQVVSRSVNVGDQPDAGKPAVVVAARGFQVITRLTPSEREAVSAGTLATIESEALSARFEAKVANIAQAQSTDDEGGALGYLTRLKPLEALDPEMLGQDVRVTIHLSLTQGEVLAVPLSALWTGADGATYVTMLEDGKREAVEVRLGPSGSGFVEVRAESSALLLGDVVLLE